jgi:hypothetical protein
LSQNLFTIIVTMAVLTTMAMPPMLRGGFGATAACAKRKRSVWSAREQEAKGFVPNLERLLLTVDGKRKRAIRLPARWPDRRVEEHAETDGAAAAGERQDRGKTMARIKNAGRRGEACRRAESAAE